jgi:short-subunit dehydrogenase
VPSPILGAYHASKYALEALSDALRMELGAFGVKVVIVEPGVTRSEFLARTMSEVARNAPVGSRYTSVYARASEIEARFDAASIGPEKVVRAIERAIMVARPRTRYVVPARFYGVIALVRLLPTRWIDAAMQRLFGLTRRALGLTSQTDFTLS